MSEIMDDISYLSQEIGPRPAGTEEEQQAALYIADQMQKRTGFTANIEDFNAATQPGLVEAICFGVAAAISLLAIIFSGLAAPAFLITLACAILYAFELIDRPLLSQVFSRGVSQNVVTRYKPGSQAGARGRKVVLVANYDSGKVQSELNGGLFNLYPTLQKAAAIALLALPIIWLIRMLFSGGAAFFNLLAAIALVLAVVPVAIFFMHKASTYNEAANNNATGVAAMLEVARMIAEGTLSEEEIASMAEAKTHTAEEAYAAGVVPEGAQLEYAEGVEQNEEERLASAKAAVAALTGEPLREYTVEQIEFTPMAQREDIEVYNENMDYGEYAYPEDEELTEQLRPVAGAQGVLEASAGVQAEAEAEAASEHEAAEASEAQAEESEAPAVATAMDAAIIANEAEAKSRVSHTQEPASTPVPATNEPAWFTTGRAKAVKPAGAENVPIRRSRYADALDAAVASSKAHFEEAARMLDEGTIERISEMQRNIGSKKPTVGVNAAPLQDLLSDENKPADAIEEADEPSGALTEAHTEDVPEEIEIDAEAEIEAAVENTEAEATAEEEPAAEVAAETEAETEAAPETNGAAPDATVAMPPINVDTLKQETESAPAPAQPEHDFSKIEAPARRYRDITLPTFESEAEEAANTPARYSNPLMSERIPRVDAKAGTPISVMEDIEPIAQAKEEAPAASAPAPAPPTPASSGISADTESVEEKRAALRNAIPSLSGEFSPVVIDEEAREEENTEVSKTGSFATAASSITLDPVGDELVADLAPEERYVDDADDSDYDENTTETGAFAGPGYVDMPESRLSRFFSRFRKKKDVEEESTQEWLDVDENFTATEVGAARGSWESFRTDVEEKVEEKAEEEPEQESLFNEYEYVDVDEEDERSWHGGAFSQMRARLLREEATEEAAAELVEEVEDELASQALENAPVVERAGSVSTPLVDTTEDARIAEEAKMIYSFRNPDINTEVWFVALGAEYAGNSGMKAFLAEHSEELRGAIIVNMEALGAGELCFIEEEGLLIAQKPSSRLKRFLHRATEITGVPTSRASITWRESAASLAMRRGLQAMTLAGMEGGKPALLGQGDDVLENIDEHTVKDHAQFVLELIKNI